MSGKSVSNSASKATFTMNANGTTVGGLAIYTGTGASTKGAATGTLVCAAPFTLGNKTLDSGDSLQVQWTLSGADNGA